MCGQGERTAGTPEGAEELTPERQSSASEASARDLASRVDPERYRASMERLFSIYSEISSKADLVMQSRCPYKDARSRCTARFECRNQFFTRDPSERPVCAGSDRIDYRSAWVDGGGIEPA